MHTLCKACVAFVALAMQFCWLAKWEKTPHTLCAMLLSATLWLDASFACKRQNPQTFRDAASSVWRENLPPVLMLFCGRPHFQFCNSSSTTCMCNASEVRWPHAFLKLCIMSFITHLVRRLSRAQQGLLDNPHPFPWEEQDHKDH